MVHITGGPLDEQPGPAMNEPRVSIVIPCYNCERTLAETIASARAQSFVDFEIVAVDDGSRDGTAAILRKAAASEPRMRVVTQVNRGLSGARNAGIRAARGRFLAFLDADDLLDVDYLQRHVAHLEDETLGVSFARVRFVDGAGEPTGQETRPKLARLRPSDLMLSNPCTAFIVVRREVFRDVGLFNEELRRVEDQEWLFRVSIGSWEIRGIDAVLASYRITAGGLSADHASMLASHRAFLASAELAAPDLVRRHRRLAEAAMKRYCARRSLEHGGDRATARQYLLAALRQAPDLLLRSPRPTIGALLAAFAPVRTAVAPIDGHPVSERPN